MITSPVAVSLRKFTPEFILAHVRWRNANKEHFTPQPDWTAGSQWKWYTEVYLGNPSFSLFVVMADELAVGVLGFNSRTREVGPVLLGDQRMRRKGVMTRAMHVLYEAFGPGLYWLRVMDGNEAAIALYEKDGYTRVMPGYGFPDGQVRMNRHVTARAGAAPCLG